MEKVTLSPFYLKNQYVDKQSLHPTFDKNKES
jgi:hypothetical protein